MRPSAKIVPEIITGSRRAGLLEKGLHREQAGLHDQGVEGCLGQENVDAAGDQSADLLGVIRDHLVEGDVAAAGVFDVDAHRELLVGRPDAAGDESGLIGISPCEVVSRPARQLGRGLVQREDVVLEAELSERDRRPIERVGLDDVGACFEIGAMDAVDQLGLSRDQHLGAVFQVA